MASLRFLLLALSSAAIVSNTTIFTTGLSAPTIIKRSSFDNPFQRVDISESGITAITKPTNPHIASSIGDHPYYFVGSKKGSAEMYQWDSSTESFVKKEELLDISKTIPYPVHSLLQHTNTTGSACKSRHQLFCGGGDRYITVWEQSDQETIGWNIVQKLGPHTGWVKALALDENNNLLHSIGCNCIETWKCSDSIAASRGVEWSHWKKRSIESSPDQGSTLSSDLLSMALWNGYIFSGGVDGRIHVWSSNPSLSMKPHQSIGAHQGRVNVLSVIPLDDTSCVLLSIGHDGSIQGRRMSSETKADKTSANFTSMLEVEPYISTSISDDKGNVLRLSAMECAKHQDHIKITIGTSNGLFVGLILMNNNEFQELWRIQLEKESSINAIATVTTTDGTKAYVLVGHSCGLSLLRTDNS